MANITGTNANNTLTGTASADTITALDGVDIVRARGGNDIVYGGSGDDVLRGEDGGDRLRGDQGTDQLFGDAGTDWALYDNLGVPSDGVGGGVFVQLSSGRAQDGYGTTDTLTSIENVIGSQYDDIIEGNGVANRLEGRSGNDVLAGGGGNDALYGGNDRDLLDGEDGNDNLYGGSGDDELYGGSGNDQLRGEDGGDLLLGGDGDDVLRGGNGIDELRGGAGDDDIYGDGGDDIIDGGAGSDFLRGSGSATSGQDIFVYDASGPEDDQGDDIIFDFVDTVDTVLFDAQGLNSFGQLDTNGNDVLDNLDTWVTVRNIRINGVTKASTVIDVSKFEGDATTQETLTFYGNIGIEQSDFIIIPDEPAPTVVVDNMVVEIEPPPEQPVDLDF